MVQAAIFDKVSQSAERMARSVEKLPDDVKTVLDDVSGQQNEFQETLKEVQNAGWW